MVRLHARWLLIFAASMAVFVSGQAQPSAVRQPPTRPGAKAVAPKSNFPVWDTVRMRGDDYVDVRDFAKRYKLKVAWTKADTDMTLSDPLRVRFSFENGQRDFYLDGVRIFLGDRVLFTKDTLWVSKTDLVKIIGPLFRPEDYLAAFGPGSPKVIVLDPGHGGIDPGTENRQLKVNEKTFALDVAARLKKLLELRGWKVLLARTTDKELSRDKRKDLLMRSEFANKNNADLFLSIHFNAAPDAIAGIETYSMSPQYMLSTGDDKGDEMTKTFFPNNRHDVANLVFGEHIHRSMLGELKTPDRGFKRGRWGVLRMLDCPGVLVECGYLSNLTEAKKINTPEWRQKIAEALADGVQGYAGSLAALRVSVDK